MVSMISNTNDLRLLMINTQVGIIWWRLVNASQTAQQSRLNEFNYKSTVVIQYALQKSVTPRVKKFKEMLANVTVAFLRTKPAYHVGHEPVDKTLLSEYSTSLTEQHRRVQLTNKWYLLTLATLTILTRGFKLYAQLAPITLFTVGNRARTHHPLFTHKIFKVNFQ